MENQKSALKTSKNSEKGMYEFFHEEFESLRAKTGIRQWEQLNEQPDSAKAIHDVITFMCHECNKPPFDIVRQDVKQRVIERAIVEDGDFIGLNAKFVRKALNAWWTVNGDRVIEAVNQKDASVYQKVDLTDEQKKRIDEMANRYVMELLQGGGPQMVPKIQPDEAKVLGKEWKSDLERKAIQYPTTTVEQAIQHELHLEYIRRNYDKYTAEKLPGWLPEEEWLQSLSEEERNRILK